jgi:hypothetical protein
VLRKSEVSHLQSCSSEKVASYIMLLPSVIVNRLLSLCGVVCLCIYPAAERFIIIMFIFFISLKLKHFNHL